MAAIKIRFIVIFRQINQPLEKERIEKRNEDIERNDTGLRIDPITLKE